MYEKLTAYIPRLQSDEFGKWFIDTKNDGTPEHPYQMPYVDYTRTIRGLVGEIYDFMDNHPEFGLNRYQDILKENGLEWSTDSMSTADVSGLDGKAVMALLLGADRAERFCDGALLRFCKNGSILRWLTRLQEIDAE
ncbi:MAG: DUF6508 domain-containing protein [Oribacterium sp.]|jgi:hypothetical protein|nr:DUF6508 domain-containing protein [Oribacterium sp.]MDY6307130.1 DUF6508 domain-containing protein [Oribacterium sp.]